MKYELKNEIYSINDNLAVNTLVVGFATKISTDEILLNLNNIKELVPLLTMKLVENNSNYYFESTSNPFDYKLDICDNVNTWIVNQFKKPLDIFNGEFLRLALYNENSLVVFAHSIITDSRGLINFAKALLIGADSFDYKYTENKNEKLNLINKLKANRLKKLECCDEVQETQTKLKVKKIGMKSNIVYSLCGGAGISTLSFFLTIALSLNKTVRKSIKIPFCIKAADNDILVNDTYNIKFKRGLEPRLSFYDNAGEIDKLFKSYIKKQPYLQQNKILNQVPSNLKAYPTKNIEYLKYLQSELYLDVLPSVDDDEIIRTMQYYPSSSFYNNGFGICLVDDKITICSILHNEESEKLFSEYQRTINLISKNSDSVINEK